MGTVREATPAKLFTAVMHPPDVDTSPLLAQLADRYGKVDFRSAPYLFGSTYYEAEMGPGLVKFFVSFGPLFPQDRLSGVKRWTNTLEEQGADARGRVFNLDPGIITHYSVVVATTKGYAHRVYLGEGIYAEPAILFRRGALEPLPWTYPDYQTPAAHDFFRDARRRLLEQLAATGSRPA